MSRQGHERKRRNFNVKLEEIKRLLENFKQREYEKYLNFKGTILYYVKQHMWADEVARKVSNKMVSRLNLK